MRLYLIEFKRKVAVWLPINIRFLFLGILTFCFLAHSLTQFNTINNSYYDDDISKLNEDILTANISEVFVEKRTEINNTGNNFISRVHGFLIRSN